MKYIGLPFLLSLTIFAYAHAEFEIKNFTNKNTLTSLVILKDTLWIGSSGGVITRDLKGTLLQSFNNSDGLGYNNVTSIAVDSNGIKWFATTGSG